MKNISYGELVDCQDYAGKVLKFYKFCNNGNIPTSQDEAENAIREYNKEHKWFKAIYGYSIRGYVCHIADCIGFMVETEC